MNKIFAHVFEDKDGETWQQVKAKMKEANTCEGKTNKLLEEQLKALYKTHGTQKAKKAK